MGSIMVDVKQGARIQWQINNSLHQMLGGLTPQINGQDQRVQSGNYCYSSFSVASIDEVKIQPSKDYHDSHLKHMQTTSSFTRVKKWRILLRLELWLQCSKNQLRNLNKNKKLLKCKRTIQIATFNIRT